nr:ABC transporter permease [Treponemataceae bacterium]
MPAVIRIALGNLWEHKSKTIILGLLIMIGVAIIIIGNAFLEASKTSLQRDFVENYTGDIMIHGPDVENGRISLFGVSAVTVGSMPSTPAIPDTEELRKIVAEYDDAHHVVANQGSVISTMLMLSSENADPNYERDPSATYPYGYAFAGSPDYYDMFSSIKLLEGTLPSQTEPTILIESTTKKNFEDYYGIPVNVGDKVLAIGIMGGQTLREVTVCGIFEKSNIDSAMVDVCYIDPNTARAFANLTYGSIFAEELPETVDIGLSSLSEDDLFGSFDGDIFEDDMFDFSDAAVTDVALSEEDYDNILGDTSLRDLLNTVDDGAWNFLLLKLKNKNDAPRVIADLNAIFREKGIMCTAVDWEGAAADFVEATGLLSGVFTVMIVLLAVVVFIVIMNTLVVSVLERTGEIGTMRALGGSRGFIRKLFFTEAVTTSGFACIAGVILGLLV